MGRERSNSPDRRHRKRSRSRSRDNNDSFEKNMIKECWKPVKDNPYDFDAWTRLLKLVEKVDDIKIARDAFDGFLKRYPYCYGYWKKYAELERQHKHYEKCLNVYERGLEAIPLSVDLWLSYIVYVKEIAQGQRQATTKSEMYICELWTPVNGEIEKAAVLFDVMIITPTVAYASHFDKYKLFVHNYEPDKILSQEEYDEMTDIVFEKIKDQLDGSPMFFIDEHEEENIPLDGENFEEVPKKIVRQRKHIDVALRGFREEIIERRQKRYLDNEREVGIRWGFESGIKRPYFHVKPLEREQIKNWYEYLDFEIKQKKKSRILFLFERCMIACALYDELWIKYATYLESITDVDAARQIYKRASEIHVPRKPGIHLAFSGFEENQGNVDAAIAILSEFDRRHPQYTAINLRQIAIERRRLVKAESTDFSTVVAKYERLAQDTSVSRKIASFYSLKLARFHAKVRHDRKLAKKIIKDAISRDKSNLQLYVQLVDLAYNATNLRDSEVVSALDFALDSRDLSVEDRFQFSIRKLEYLEELGSDVAMLQQHMVEHLAMEKSLEHPSVTVFSGKRAPLNKDAVVEPAEKLARLDQSGTDPNTYVLSQHSSSSSLVGNTATANTVYNAPQQIYAGATTAYSGFSTQTIQQEPYGGGNAINNIISLTTSAPHLSLASNGNDNGSSAGGRNAEYGMQ
uniref:Pre-mRNA-processing factor 39 n=1 Tax=Ditylenchus dipsaci TaxID=166011 RepID=A0A915DJI4_9BILA